VGGRNESGGKNDFVYVNDMASLTLAAPPFVASGAHATSPILGIASGRWTSYWAAPDRKVVWGARLGPVKRSAHPKSLWGTVWWT
jgi:hypothetical protein